MILLKSENILPFTPQKKIALVGPGAQSQDILEAWPWQRKKEEVIPLTVGAKKLTTNLLVAQKSFDYFEPTVATIEEVLALASQANKVVVALGETDWMSGEVVSRSDIRLPGKQLAAVAQTIGKNPNVVVTVYSGRPLDLQGMDVAKGTVQAWQPGMERSNALTEILWGQYNPSGRLSTSFPETVGQVSIFYNVDNTGCPYEPASEEKYASKYLDVPNYAKYPFGFGLSHSYFSYQPI